MPVTVEGFDEEVPVIGPFSLLLIRLMSMLNASKFSRYLISS